MKRRRQLRYRPRLSELPLIITSCLSIPLILFAWKTGLDLEASFGHGQATPTRPDVHQASVGVKGPNRPVDCIEIIERSRHNSTDTGRNRLFLKYVDDNP